MQCPLLIVMFTPVVQSEQMLESVHALFLHTVAILPRYHRHPHSTQVKEMEKQYFRFRLYKHTQLSDWFYKSWSIFPQKTSKIYFVKVKRIY